MLNSFTKSEHFKPLLIWALLPGGLFAVALGGVAMDASAAMWGFFIGALGGFASHVGRIGRRRAREARQGEPGVPDPFLELVGSRHAVRIIGLLFFLPSAGFLISHLVTGVGAYGFFAGVLAVAIAGRLMWRFGGPGDPRIGS